MIKRLSDFNPSNTVVIIPAYEPPHSVIDYTKELLGSGVRGVVVVNDGSGEKYREIYDEIAKLENCFSIGYDTNMGKGYALRYAFSFCKETFSEDTVFVTADCDGQHLASDVISVAAMANEHRGALVLGSRDFSSPNVPARSRSGNIQARRIFKLLYRISVSDTQTGLRAFSYSLFDSLLSIKGNRFEYEMNMLIYFKKHGIDILEVPIETVYLEKSEDVERVSHYRTFRDSARVFFTLIKNLEWYLLSSVLSAVADVLAFYLLLQYVFVYQHPAINTLLATVSARIISSVINFTINFKLVFNGKKKRSMFKYYFLWLCQLGLSYTYAFGLTALTGNAKLATLFKAILDFLVGLLSYQIQNRWVFVEHERGRLHFFGPISRIAIKVHNTFSKKYRSFIYPLEGEGAVYVCRHLNLQGPTAICKSMNFDVHPMVLNCFFTFKSCHRQYSEFTFTERQGKRGIKRIFGKISAFFSAIFVPPFIRSMRSIPVFRGGTDSAITFRRSMEYLMRGENIVVYPDIEYDAQSEDSKSEIYTGFLFLEKLYFRKFGKHLNFIVIKADKERRCMTELGRVSFSGSEDFTEESRAVAAEIHSLLMSN